MSNTEINQNVPEYYTYGKHVTNTFYTNLWLFTKSLFTHKLYRKLTKLLMWKTSDNLLLLIKLKNNTLMLKSFIYNSY